jgi:hypothetical protein
MLITLAKMLKGGSYCFFCGGGFWIFGVGSFKRCGCVFSG